MSADRVSSLAGQAAFSYRLLQQAPIQTEGGRVRIVDARTFPAASTIAAALVEIEPGHMRELHWHPTTVPAEVDDHYTLVVGIEGNIALTLDALAQQLTPKSGLVAIGQKIRAVLQEEREKGALDALFPVKPQRLVADIRAALARVDPLQAVVYSAALESGTGNAVTIAMIY